MPIVLIIVATFLISAVIFIPVGVYIRKRIAESKIQSAESEARRLLENVKIEAENMKKEELIKAKEEILQIRNELDQEIKERRGDVQVQEKRLIQKEENLEKRAMIYDGKEKDLERKFAENEEKKQELEGLVEKEKQELERISGLTEEQAKQKLLNDLEKEVTSEKAAIIREAEAKAKEDALKNAREIVGFAIHTESTVLSVRFVIVPVTKLWLPGCSVTLPISKSVVRGTCFRFTDVKLSQLG